MTPVRVLIVDDSALIRKLLTNILDASPDIEVIGTAVDPFAARRKIKELNPDVITLDIEMPRMDGLDFLEKIMTLRPMPVVMISSLAEKNAGVALRAMELGAVDYVSKPKCDVAHTLEDYSEEIIQKVISASRAKVGLRNPVAKPATQAELPVDSRPSTVQSVKSHFKTTDKIIAIGASTGGTVAIADVLEQLPASTPGIVISQHIPETFSRHFAERVNQISEMKVAEAKDGEQILPGHVYVAPGDSHLTVVRNGALYLCKLDQTDPVNRHRPSVDVLFDSVARNVGQNAVGVILTGMGKDGARGMKAMKEAGAKTIAQDEHSSVVWGMPGEAVKLGGIDAVEPLEKIPDKINTYIQ